MRVKLSSFLIIASFILASICYAGEIQGKFSRVPGQQYRSDGKTVEVTEFMSFYCGHCYAFERSIPVIKGNFPGKVKWRTVPIYWGNASPKPGEAYLLAEEAGKGEQMKKALFHALFVEKKDIGKVEVLEELAAGIGLGFDFSVRLRSGEKAGEIKNAFEMVKAYNVTSTPTLVIAGNLMADPEMTGNDIDAFRDNAITIIKSILKR